MIKSLKDLLDKFSRFTNSLVYDGGICKRLSKYKNISDQEIKKREVLSYLLENSNFKLDNISLEKDILTIVYQNSDKTKIEEYINKKYKIISSQVENIDLYIRIKI